MKKLFALVMTLVLCLSTCALAEDTFAFNAQEYVDAYTEFNKLILSTDVTWTEPMLTSDGEMKFWLGSAEGMNDLYVGSGPDGLACMAVGANMTVNIATDDTGAKANAFGTTIAAISFSTRYVETGRDLAAFSDEITPIEQACSKLVQSVFSEANITTAVEEGSYSEVADIAGHAGVLTLLVNVDAMELEVQFCLLP